MLQHRNTESRAHNVSTDHSSSRLGMIVRHFLKSSADKMEKIGNKIASLLFVVIVFAAIASEFDTLVDNLSSLGPAVLILNVMMLAIGLGSSNYFDLNEGQSLTVSIESGIQNATGWHYHWWADHGP